MRIKLFSILFLLNTTVSGIAQKNLVVYHITGNVNMIVPGKSNPAKRGDVISKNTSLQVKNESSCMLIAEKGKSLQVEKPGTYTFDALQKMFITAGQTGGSQKFFSYVYESMFHDKKSEQLSVTPVVFRGEELMKVPSNNTIMMTDVFTARWKKPAGKIPVRLTLLNSSEEIIVDTVLKNVATIIIDTRKYKFGKGIFKWKVEEADTKQPSEKYFYFLVPAKHDRKKILEDLRVLQDKKLSNEVKLQLQNDIFQKWKQFYSDRK